MSAEALLDLAARLDAAYDGMSANPGSAFAVMCLMSDGLVALGSDGSLNGNTMEPRQIAAALRARASESPQ